MLGYWPNGYPDELLYSLCARYRERIGSPSSRSARLDLFGVKDIHDIVTFPSRLEHLAAQLPPAQNVTVAELINSHTVVPFHRMFMAQESAKRLETAIAENAIDSYESRGRSFLMRGDCLRYCAACAISDRERFGEAYWHRIHQLGHITVCPKHVVLLQRSALGTAEAETHFVSAEKAIPTCGLMPRSVSESPEFSFAIWLAQQSAWMLDHPGTVFLPDQIAQLYKMQLFRRKHASISGTIRMAEVEIFLSSLVTQRLLTSIGFDTGITLAQSHRVRRLVKRGIGTSLEHLMLLWCLDLSVDGLRAALSKIGYFESGPWPCLNPVCTHYRVNVIEKCERKTDARGQLFGLFTCACGFCYSRRGPDPDGASRYHQHKTIATGPTWDHALATMWRRSNLPVQEIASRLGTYHYQVMQTAARMGLPLKRGERPLKAPPIVKKEQLSEARERKRKEYRATLLHVLSATPSITRVELQRTCIPREMVWLQNNDHSWLEKTLPPKAMRGVVSRTSPIDWTSRDSALAVKVEAVRNMLLNDNRSPVRITRNRLLNALGFRRGLQSPSNLPKTNAALNNTAESLEECAVRRLYWLAKRAEELGEYWTRQALLEEARIRPHWRDLPMFIEAIADAERRAVRDRLTGKDQVRAPHQLDEAA